MSAVQSLRTATGALSRNPVLFLGGLAYALVVLPQRALQLAGIPLAPALLQLVTFFVTPFVLAGVLGMAREALDGDTAFDAFTATGKDRYVDILLATLVEFGIQLAFGVAFIVLALVALVAGGGGAGPAALVGAALGVLLALAYLVVLFLIQFYPVIVVVDDAGPVDAITDSVDFVRGNVVSTLGYSVITVVLGGLAALPVSGFAAYRFLTSGPGTGDTPGPIGGGMSPGGPGSGAGAGAPQMADMFAGAGLGLSTPEVIALALVSAVTTALFFAFRQTYATAFYRRNGRSVEERVLDDEL
ncbi:DUF7847 domain-containing protein [Haloplanus aerogenes]|uniref:DUF7847 domain-containing protein n=1 Tax=Haloplanus aerogenes TaxID=660522 RepID=A0A3M0DAB2_9EURY|nr:hypothetical protein [Haloplanus aerogenes]AZH26052.1 hypothetical protein DU502_12095 [Haloplanus aerogenes]RMB18498.1 hypothetical protein ATH50_1958 [Haloplanus aerogenes]